MDKNSSKIIEDLGGVKHHFTLLEHPQSKWQAKATNDVFLRELERRIEGSKDNWVEEIPLVL